VSIEILIFFSRLNRKKS